MTSIKNSAENWYLNNRDAFIFELLVPELFLEIEYESDSVDDLTHFYIKFNDEIVSDVVLKNNTSNLILKLDPIIGKQILEISMSGKKSGSTVVENGVIVKDTFIKLLDLKINNYKLLTDYDFFRDNFEYILHKDNTKISPAAGFWEDATLKIVFDFPFDLWFNTTSTKNSVISDTLKLRTVSDLNSLIKDLEQSLKKLI